MQAKTAYAPPAAGHCRLARGIRLHADYLVCEYPLRILWPGAIALRLLACCSEECAPGELAAALDLPLERVERLCEQLRWKGLLETGPAPPPTSWPSVSVIIPSYNREAQLERCLRSLLQARYPSERLEVIAVDDGSSDGTAAMIERLAPDFAEEGLVLRYIRHHKRQGAAQSRNDGAGLASFDLLAFLDSDCIATSDWLAALVPAFSDPSVVAAGGQMRAWERRALLGRYEDKKSSLNMGKMPQQVTLPGPLTYLPAANLLVRRKAWSEAGGFAALPFGEDVDFCQRLLLSGARILYLPEGLVFHDYRITLLAFLRTRASYASAEAALQKRHPGGRRVLLLPAEQAAFVGMAIGGMWGLLGMVVKWLGGAFLGRSSTGNCPDATTGCPPGASLHVQTPHLHPPSSRLRRICGGMGVGRYVGMPLVGIRQAGTLTCIGVVILTAFGAIKRLRRVRGQGVMLDPLVVLRATLRGHLAYTYHLCRHLTRYYMLPMLVGGIIVPPVLLLLLIMCGIVIGVDYARLRPEMRLSQFAVCSLLDDCAYELGVVWGCIKQRTWKPLVPVIRKKQ